MLQKADKRAHEMAFSSSKKIPSSYLPGGLLLLLGGLYFFTAWLLLRDVQNAKSTVPQMETVNQLTVRLFEGTHGFSRIHQFVMVGLSAEQPFTTTTLAAVQEERKKTAATLVRAFKTAQTLYPEDSQLLTEKWQSLQEKILPKVDRDVALKMAQRDPSLLDKWVEESTSFFQQLDNLQAHALATATQADSAFTGYITLNLQILQLRISAGIEGATLLSTIASGKPPSPKTLQTIYGERAKTLLLWTDTQRDIAALENPALTKALAPVQKAYFETFLPQQDAVIQAGVNETPYPMSWQDNQAQLAVALASFPALATAISKAGQERLDAKKASVEQQYLWGGAPAAAALVIILCLFWLLSRTSEPGVQVGAVLNALQKGNLHGLHSAHMTKEESTRLAQYMKTSQEQVFEAKRSEALARVQRDLSVELSGCSNLGNALQHMLQAVCSIGDIDCGAIYLENPETQTFTLAVHGGLSEQFVAVATTFDADSPLVQALLQQEPIYMQYAPTNPIVKNLPAEEGIRAVAILPVEHDGHVIASINLGSHSVDDLPVSARIALEAIAAQIGGTLARLRAENTLANLNHTLEQRVEQEAAQLLEKERMLVQQSRMAAMGEMIGVIAHQWRQPLNAVAVNIQNIKDAYEYNDLNPEQLKQAVETAMEQLSFMSKTIDDFRNFFRPDKKKTIFDAKLAAGDVLAMLSPQLRNSNINYRVVCEKHQHHVENFKTYSPDCQDMEVYGYENELKQVILNLVSNSKDAIQDRVAQSLMEPNEQGDVSITFRQEDTHIVILLRDNGGGIPASIMERIFEPYFTTKEPGRGTGIGLYMAKVIIEKNMGGKLTVRNINSGTEFRIEL